MTETSQEPLPGGPALRKHIDGLEMSIPAWAEAKGLNRVTVQRLVNGELQTVSVELAFDIQEATGEAVDWKLWVPPESVRNERREQRQAAARARARAAREARTDEAASAPEGEEPKQGAA